jgi:hypothetical protein
MSSLRCHVLSASIGPKCAPKMLFEQLLTLHYYYVCAAVVYSAA